jgi:hypothetical protein
MTQQYDNDNTGALFRNEKKRSQNSPDHTGQVQIKCCHCEEVQEMWISAWVKEARNGGRKFFSLAFTTKDEPARTPAPSDPKNFDDFDDDIPF